MATVAAPAGSLTHRSALDLARAIREGEVTSREVVQAHVDLARAINPRINAVVADRYEAALADADAADARVAEGGADLGPFHGVPCTIKESIAFEGMPNAAGLVARGEHRAERTAPTAQRLIGTGAIPLGVTNTSELTMWIESENRLYGRTRNAYDPSRIAGGSSGGEGAAVGSGIAPVGLGSDIGGSIRLPAFFNGVFGHKCSSCLVPNSGQFPEGAGEASRMLAVGPLTRRAEDLMPFLRAIAGPDGEDEYTRDVELGDPADVSIEGLDVIVSDDVVGLGISREMRYARERAAGALQSAGARVRREPLRSVRRAMEYYLATLQTGSESDVAAILGRPGERLKPGRMAWDAIRGRGDHTLAIAILAFAERVNGSMPEKRTRKSVEAGRALAKEVEDVMDGGVILHPPFARVAPRHGRTIGRPWVLTHAAVFNMLGLPATEVPMGLDRDGLPLGVQVVAGMDEDHRTIAVALELERAFGGWVPPGA
jgi:Asp-tRNA(Asn)/Glu-tRNA(Gln) amidotransferase A subunit family amidase